MVMKNELLQFIFNELEMLYPLCNKSQLTRDIQMVNMYWNTFDSVDSEWLWLLTLHNVKSVNQSGRYKQQHDICGRNLILGSVVVVTKYMMEEDIVLTEYCEFLDINCTKIQYMERNILKTLHYRLNPGPAYLMNMFIENNKN